MTRARTDAELTRRGIRLEWATNAWNLLEVVITIWLGIQARSLALVAFGLDSVVEVFASTVVIWNLRDNRHDPGDQRVHRALRLIAVAFWLLGAFIVVASVRGLILAVRPESSPGGIVWLALAATAMFSLALVKRSTARALGSETLDAEASLTFLDGCLSSSILLALVLNTVLGWWWTDAAAALIVGGFAIAQGFRNWRNAAPHLDEDPGTAGR